MVTRAEFNLWLDDFANRYPSTGEYLKRREKPGLLLDTWYKTLQAFELETLSAVTSGIIRGIFLPIANVDLGQFAEQVRQRARQVLEQRRREQPRERHVSDKPHLVGNHIWGVRCAIAMLQLLEEAGIADTRTNFRETNSVNPYYPYGAAIILADKHTTHEESIAHQTLAKAGITWDQVKKRAVRVDNVFPTMQRGTREEHAHGGPDLALERD